VRKKAIAENIRYVVHCPGMMVRGADGRTARDALAATLESGTVPSWLAPVPLPAGNPLRLYRVVR
jgi:hypothetical protein